MGKPQRPDAERVALAQQRQIESLECQLGILQNHATTLGDVTARQEDALSDLDVQMAGLFASAGIKRPESNDFQTENTLSSLRLSAIEEATIQRQLPDLSLPLTVPDGAGDWAAYIAEIDSFIERQGIDLERDPFEQLLTPSQVAAVTRRFNDDFGSMKWDRWDYGMVAITVLAGTLIDYFIVATPLGGTFKGHPQRGSPITQWLRAQSEKLSPSGEKSVPRNGVQAWIRRLAVVAENYAKVPYDLSRNVVSESAGKAPLKVEGLRPKLHRLMSPGHDPLLGFVFGVIDILRNTCTLIDENGNWHVIQRDGEPLTSNPLEALLITLIHLFSDVFTKQGLPAPFMTVLQGLRVDSGFSLTENGPTLPITDIVRHMYANGYDLRHFTTMSLVPAVAEIMIRLYHAVRTYEAGESAGVSGIKGRAKLAGMLVATHGLLASGNILKTALYRWDPKALNLAQYLALAKQMFSLLKLAREREALVQEQILGGWERLLQEGQHLPA